MTGAQPAPAGADAAVTEPAVARHAAPPGRSRRRTLLYALVVLVVADLVVGVAGARRAPEAIERDRLAEGAERVAQHDGQAAVLVGWNGANAFISDATMTDMLGPDYLIENALMSTAGVIGMWDLTYDHLYRDQGIVPTAVVIAFQTDQLEDRDDLDWATVGRLYSDWGSLADRVRDAPDLAARVDVVASRVSSVVGHRPWLTDLWSGRIPNHTSVPRAEPQDSDRPTSYDTLAGMVAELEADGVAVTVVAMPRTGGYVVADELVRAVESNGATFVDLRQVLPPADPATANQPLPTAQIDKLSRQVANAIEASTR